MVLELILSIEEYIRSLRFDSNVCFREGKKFLLAMTKII